jgi:GNAT superfamily N-acetyltransferase
MSVKPHQLTFRPITETDFAQAEAMKRATVMAATGDPTLFDQWFTAERPLDVHLRKLMAFDPASCVFALLDNEIVGHLHLMIVEDGTCGYLNDIYLKPEHRGRGLGEQLHAYSMDFFNKHGVSRATLRTNPAQPKLVAFYERMGWELGAPASFGLVWMGRTL